MAQFRLPPACIPGTKTFVYKTIGDLKLEVDVLIPENLPSKDAATAVLFIHGGSWVFGNRTEYCRPLFKEFLARNYVVASADYRLLPESDFVSGQLEDIRDLEKWMREGLSDHLSQEGFRCTIGDVIVAGASAGALLALLTPKLWNKNPTAILSISGPTDLHQIPPSKMDHLNSITVPELTSKLISSVIDVESPIASAPIGSPKSLEEFFGDPRRQIGMQVFHRGLVAEFLLRGLIRRCLDDGTVEWRFPDNGAVPESEIDAMSPLHLAKQIAYPPTYQILGSIDNLFDVSHAHKLGECLNSRGIAHKEHIVNGQPHGFDNFTDMRDDVHLSVICPAVDWIAGIVDGLVKI